MMTEWKSVDWLLKLGPTHPDAAVAVSTRTVTISSCIELDTFCLDPLRINCHQNPIFIIIFIIIT